MRKQLHPNGIRIFTDLSAQSYPWNETASCWFDSSMEALFFCFLHLQKRFKDAMIEYQQEVPDLFKLSEHMVSCLDLYQSVDSIPELQNTLFDLRNKTATSLQLDLSTQSHPLVRNPDSLKLIFILIFCHRLGSWLYFSPSQQFLNHHFNMKLFFILVY
jgi:hypothetical protein